MRHDALRVVAHLASPLAGGGTDMLDGILLWVASRLAGKPADLPPGYKVDRRAPCPDASRVQLYVARERAGRHAIPLTTSPILGRVLSDEHEYVCKRVGVEHAGLLAPAERKVVVTSNTWTKSYRLPVRSRRVDRVAWLAVGNRREMKALLKEVPAVGADRAHGNGRVAEWEVERLGDPPHRYWPWWVGSEWGPVLMRPLPADWPGLPAGLVGARRGYGAVCPPYWHPDGNCERVEPCD